MAYSFIQYPGNGVQAIFTVSFPFLSRSHVIAKVDGAVTTAFTWLSDTQVQFGSPPASGTVVELRRVSSPGSALVNFSDGARLKESDLDTAMLQTFYLTQEAMDNPSTSLRAAFDGTWDALGYRIKNLATPTLSTDAANKAYVDSVAVASGNVPSPANPADDFKELVAAAGGFTWQSPTSVNMRLRADPTGVTEASTQIQTAIDSGVAVIDGGGGTYKVTTTLVLRSGIEFVNMEFDVSTAADGFVLFQAYGSLGTSYTVTAPPSKGAASVAVSDATGLANGDLCILKSNDDFSPVDSGKRGEWVRVNSVSGLTINLRQRLRHTYTTGYVLYKPVLLRDIAFRNVRIIGKGDTGSAAQYGLRAYLCENVTVDRCFAEKLGYAAFSLETVFGGEVNDCHVHMSNYSLGAAYGVSITGGCEGVTVKGGNYSFHRHAVTVGGTFFTNYGISISGINTLGCSDAGIDVHPNAMHVVIDGNTVDCYSTDATQAGDGITVQGADMSITDNKVRGWRRSAILVQPLTAALGPDDGFTVAGNQLTNPQAATGADGIVIDMQKSGVDTRCATVADNRIEAESATTGRGIAILNTTNSSALRSATISGNTVLSRSESLYIQAANLHLLQDISITGNSFASLSAVLPVISLISNAEVSKYLSVVQVNSNVLRGGSYGVQLSNAPDRVTVISNLIQGFATASTDGTIALAANNYWT